MSDGFKFGDLVQNTAASLDNPQRYGYFVRRGYREGKLNPGPFVEMTDAQGKFWTCKGDRLVKIGAKTLAVSPSPQETKMTDEHYQSIKTQADEHYMRSIKARLEQLYNEHPDDPRLREFISDEVDWLDEQLGSHVSGVKHD